MCELREIPFRPHESLASQDQAEVDRLVRMANRGIHDLYEYWLGYYREFALSASWRPVTGWVFTAR